MRQKIGILQGRLSDAPKGRLQYLPKKWSEEFNKAILDNNLLKYFSKLNDNLSYLNIKISSEYKKI